MTELDRQISLPDGRRLAIRECGDLDGFPVLHLGGAPGGCRLDAGLWHDRARSVGLRFLGVDRPGVGLSDRHIGGGMSDWSRDVGALIDALGFDRVAISAVSGGGPFGLAAAWAHPTRVAHLTLIAPTWFPRHSATRGMPTFNRLLWWSSRHSRPLFRFFVNRLMRPVMTNAERSIAVGLPEPDRLALEAHPEFERSLKEGFLEAIRNGVEGVVDDAMLITALQPFTLQEVTVPVSLWHGEADRNVPIAVGRAVEARLPHCDAHFLSGEGHLSLPIRHMALILEDIVRQIDSSPPSDTPEVVSKVVPRTSR